MEVLASGLEDFVLCLGHIGFLDTLLAAHGLGPDEAARIKLLFSKKDFVALQEEVKRMKISEEAGRSILQVPHLRGGAEVLAAARELLPPGRGTAMLAVLQSVWEVLEDYGADSYVTLDLGLVRMLDYYTGMVLKAIRAGLAILFAAAAVMTGYLSTSVPICRQWDLPLILTICSRFCKGSKNCRRPKS